MPKKRALRGVRVGVSDCQSTAEMTWRAEVGLQFLRHALFQVHLIVPFFNGDIRSSCVGFTSAV